MSDIVIDLSGFYAFLDLPPDQMLIKFFLTIGWIPIAIAFLWGSAMVWLFYRTILWGAKQKRVLLAIDIPRGNDKSPKAVENIFTYLAGAHQTYNLYEKWWNGEYQLQFSFEIVSIDGYTQFLIHTPVASRNLVESAIYSQYPDAEITEVNDYTEGIPTKYPDDEYDVWGSEFIQAKNAMYPIKTYKNFEHMMGEPEMQFKDPMAALMDLCSSLKKGEQLWYQMLVYPTGFDWVEKGDEEVAKILGEKKSKANFADKIVDNIMGVITFLSEMVYTMWSDIEDKDKDSKDDGMKMMNLKPKEKQQVEAIHEKISKLGFECKHRMVYVAKKEVMNKPKVVSGFVGYMKQFMDLNLNNLKPDMAITATSTDYFFAESRLNTRKNNIVRGYKGRSGTIGRKRGIYNIEELATLWHFPIEAVVKAPLIQKAPGRKSEPPMSLPVQSETEIGTRAEMERRGITKGDIFTDNGDIPIIDISGSMTSSDAEKKEQNIITKKSKLEEDSEISQTSVEQDFAEKKTEKKGLPPSNLPFN